ncbi:MAG: hypothetical protein Q8M11_03825 [Sulfuritalea sp.]|jgi:hypothetical protein|nr:hypothetical protein [Sulfuritalea sp.]MDP1984189.1 hypothetical protein [Sulfuritalea sp.]
MAVDFSTDFVGHDGCDGIGRGESTRMLMNGEVFAEFCQQMHSGLSAGMLE